MCRGGGYPVIPAKPECTDPREYQPIVVHQQFELASFPTFQISIDRSFVNIKFVKKRLQQWTSSTTCLRHLKSKPPPYIN